MYFDEAPKTNPADFYNFEEQRSELMHALREGARLIVIKGARRTGKTSLLLTALNEIGFPYVVIDARVFGKVPTIPHADFIRVLEKGLNDFLFRQKKGIRRVLDVLKGLRGVEVEFPVRVRLSGGPPERRADFLDLLTCLGELAKEEGKTFVLVLDEGQELRKIAGYNLTLPLAHIYDYVKSVQVIVTGSQVGVLTDFLKTSDPTSALFGRVRVEIEMPRLSADKAKEFLVLGCRQAGIKPKSQVLDDAVKKLDGIGGWLTYAGALARRLRKFDERVLENAFEEGAKLAAEEMENFLAVRPAARKRYLSLLIRIARLGRGSWTEIKEGLQIAERKRIADQVFNRALETLKKWGFICKNEDGTYSVADPLLTHALLTGVVKEHATR
ncbi:MAG: ATP-binding protein [Candidatus Hadarchaeales archaeon]